MTRDLVPSRVIWGGRDLKVTVVGAHRMRWMGGTMHFTVPVTCGGVEHTLDLDTGTWTWTITRHSNVPRGSRPSFGVA